eukprot:scaffold145471_cov17-Tisochrysis_lutea.AAC.1
MAHAALPAGMLQHLQKKVGVMSSGSGGVPAGVNLRGSQAAGAQHMETARHNLAPCGMCEQHAPVLSLNMKRRSTVFQYMDNGEAGQRVSVASELGKRESVQMPCPTLTCSTAQCHSECRHQRWGRQPQHALVDEGNEVVVLAHDPAHHSMLIQ